MAEESEKYTDDDLYVIAHQFSTLKEFKAKNGTAYEIASQRGIIDSICTHMDSVFYTNEEIIEAAKSHTKQSFMKECPNLYNAARKRKGLLKKCFPTAHFRGEWTNEKCANEALKYTTLSAFARGSSGAYRYARKNGILDDICKHMNRLIIWTDESAFERATRYKMMSDFQKNAKGAYCYCYEKPQLLEKIRNYYKSLKTK